MAEESLALEAGESGNTREDHFVYTEAERGTGEAEEEGDVAVAGSAEAEDFAEDTEAWPLLTKALLSTILMGDQQQALDAIAASLTCAVKPILDKWAASRAALKEADAQHGVLKEKNDNILLRSRSLKKKLVDSQSLLASKSAENEDLLNTLASREGEIESLEQRVLHMEEKLVAAHSQHMREVEVLTRESQAAENAVAHLVLEADVREKEHGRETSLLQEKIKEGKKDLARLQEQLDDQNGKIRSLEQELAKVEMDLSRLDECLVDTINIKQALEYQLALHERVSS